MGDKAKEVCALVSGYRLYVKDNPAGGRTYYSDEIGGGVVVWDTALVDESTLLAAMLTEKRLQHKERNNRRDHEKLTSC